MFCSFSRRFETFPSTFRCYIFCMFNRQILDTFMTWEDNLLCVKVKCEQAKKIFICFFDNLILYRSLGCLLSLVLYFPTTQWLSINSKTIFQREILSPLHYRCCHCHTLLVLLASSDIENLEFSFFVFSSLFSLRCLLLCRLFSMMIFSCNRF